MLQVEGTACAKVPGSGASSVYSWNSLKNLKSRLVVAGLMVVVRWGPAWLFWLLFSEHWGAIDGYGRAMVTHLHFIKVPL